MSGGLEKARSRMTNATIDFLRQGEAKEASAVLGGAFVTSSPNCIAVWRAQGEEEIIKQAAIFRLLKLERQKSIVIVAKIDNRIVGALNMIEWPHCQLSPLETLKMLPRMFLILKGAAFRGAMARAKKMQSVWAENDPKKPHWHLGPIGVLPETQRKGIGSQMLTRGCEFVDQKMGPAYLETDKVENLALYERFGFSTIAEADVMGALNWFMWRNACETVASAPSGAASY
jgi:ribosomal protein S18 acetylase RimI-like enzyme